MGARYRVVLQGFSEFERNALAFCLKLTGERAPAYEIVPRMADADLLIADADMSGVIDTVVRAGRTGETVFVGRQAPAGSPSHVSRPIDPNLIVRELDQLLDRRKAARQRPAAAEAFPPSRLDDALEDAPEARTIPGVFDGLSGLRDPDALPLVFELPELPPEAPEPPPEPPTAAAHPIEPSPSPAPAEAAAAAPEPAAAPPRPAPRPPPAAEADAAAAAALAQERANAKAAARRAARRARLQSQPGAADNSRPPDALVLDDSEIAQVFLCRLLADFGFRPHAVQSSTEALELLVQQPFRVVFLDVQLDEQDEHDGIDLCQRIKHDAMAPDGVVPVVMVVSGQARPADRVRAGLAGSDAFLTKPLSRGSVARALESCNVAMPADARRRER